jgi:hypothetical protein
LQLVDGVGSLSAPIGRGYQMTAYIRRIGLDLAACRAEDSAGRTCHHPSGAIMEAVCGVDIDSKALANKVGRGTFSLAFFLQCIKALGVRNVALFD